MLFGHLTSSVEKCLFRSFASFLNGLFFYFELQDLFVYFGILEINPLSIAVFANIFSFFMVCFLFFFLNTNFFFFFLAVPVAQRRSVVRAQTHTRVATQNTAVTTMDLSPTEPPKNSPITS